MNSTAHLCPRCAAHLRVPPQLDVMCCDYCDAELVFIADGGVRGLAVLPNVDHVVPYSDPRQHPSGRSFDARELLENRRTAVLLDARRRHSFWSGLFWGCLLVLLSTGFVGAVAVHTLFSGAREAIELSALAALMAMVLLPVLGYVAVFFQGRARLACVSVSRWTH